MSRWQKTRKHKTKKTHTGKHPRPMVQLGTFGVSFGYVGHFGYFGRFDQEEIYQHQVHYGDRPQR